MRDPLKKRLLALKGQLALLAKVSGPTCLVLSSAPEMRRSGDQFFPFRQDSDLFYCTHAHLRDSALVFSTREKKPILIVPPKDPVKLLWDGPSEEPRTVAARIGAELRVTPRPLDAIIELTRKHERLLHSSVPHSLSSRLASHIQSIPAHLRHSLPRTLDLSDIVLEKLRLHKDALEQHTISEASNITIQALHLSLEMINPGVPEFMTARTIEYWFGMHSAVPAFGTIVGAGKSGATLHHRSGPKKMAMGDLVLVDCGAELDLYSSDLTRVFPVGGRFDAAQRALYEIVLEAQRRALNKIRHGATIRGVYDAAALALTEGLVELKVLRGKPRALFAKKAYKPYFPHGIGHSVGLDVHDIGRHRGNPDAQLSRSMVFTVEPGLYFPKATKYLKPCGVRIEDTVLVTDRGHRSFTEKFPKTPEEIEALVGQ